MAQDSWGTPQTFVAQQRSVQKRIGALERRDGAMGMIVSVIGEAQAKRAILIADWNDPITANNGYFWSRPGALHSPNPTRSWTGGVIGRSDDSGMQEAWNTDDLEHVLYFMRTYVDDGTGQGRNYSDWRQFATPTGLIETEHFGETVTDLLESMADDIDNAAVSLLLFEQDAEPVPGVAGVPAEIPVGSVWIDTNDNRHSYSWNGTAWVSTLSTLFASIQTDLDSLTIAVETAADNAADALDFVTARNRNFVQPTAPTDPTDGQALTVNDEWRDSDDDNKVYRWNGTTWELALVWYEGPIFTDGDISGSTVTGGTLQTETTIGRGIKMNSAGMALYAPSPAPAGTPKFVLDTTTGAVTMTGAVLTSGDITGGTITGVHLRTNTDPTLGIHLTSAGMAGFDGGHVQRFFLDAATGILTLDGGLLTGGSITGAVVTGGTLQTEATAGRGFKINSTGAVLYAPPVGGSGPGIPKFTLDAATGTIVLAGELIGAGVITGPAFRTAGTGNRIEITASPGNKIDFFSGNSRESVPGSLTVDDKPPAGGQEDVFVRLETPRLFDAGADSRTAFLNMSARFNAFSRAVDTNMGLGADIIQVTGAVPGTTRERVNLQVFGTLEVAPPFGGVAELRHRGVALPSVQSGEAVVFTDAGGYAVFGFPQGFAGTPTVVANGGNDEQVYVLPPPAYRNNGGFTAQFRYKNGVVIANGIVRILWIAAY